MVASVGVRATQALVLAAGAYPSAGVRATQSLVLGATDSQGNEVRTTQAVVLAAALGRTNDPHVRAWGFTLDGHDFYVLRLGKEETLVLDLTTEQWSIFGNGDGSIWNAYNGANWLGGSNFSASYGSNVLVGDDGIGVLYLLDPTGDIDDDANEGADVPRPFTRKVFGQLTTHGYNRVRCYSVELQGSIGAVDDDTLTDINLSYSDDRGGSYVDAGTIAVDVADYQARVNWRSLGSFTSPGRLFQITDTGALRRIDALDVLDDTEEKG